MLLKLLVLALLQPLHLVSSRHIGLSSRSVDTRHYETGCRRRASFLDHGGATEQRELSGRLLRIEPPPQAAEALPALPTALVRRNLVQLGERLRYRVPNIRRRGLLVVVSASARLFNDSLHGAEFAQLGGRWAKRRRGLRRER